MTADSSNGAQPAVARVKRVDHFAGAGCAIQALALLAPFLVAAIGSAIAGMVGAMTGFVLGLFGAVVLFAVGSSKAHSWRCSNCGNPVADKRVTLCPVCRVRLVP